MATRSKTPTTTAVRRLLRGLTLDDVGKVRAEIALALADVIDQKQASATLTKELRATLLELVPPETTASQWDQVVGAIFKKRTS